MGWWGHVERMCELAQAEVSRAAQPSSALSVYLQAHNQKQCVSPQGTEILQLLVILYHQPQLDRNITVWPWASSSPCPPPPSTKMEGLEDPCFQWSEDQETHNEKSLRPRCSGFFQAQRRSWGKRFSRHHKQAEETYPQRYSHKCLAVRPQLWTKSVREEGSAAGPQNVFIVSSQTKLVSIGLNLDKQAS